MAAGSILTRGAQVRRRPAWMESTIGSWIVTTDHKKIGILYIYTSVIFFLLGGIEAMIIRTQLAVPNNPLIQPELYNELFTMHATIMIFLFMMPIFTGFGNYVVPLMVGARDMAFPRMNQAGYWFYLAGGIMLATALLLGVAPNAGWFAYAPLTEATPVCLSSHVFSMTAQQQAQAAATAAAQGVQGCFSAGINIDIWAMALTALGISSIMSGINFIVTILRMRAPGMTINRMPLFSWMIMVMSFLLIFALPSLTAAVIFLFADRHLGTHFYQASAGGDPLLWQHLFWSFGHPEVYILILPAFGMVSEIIPVFSGKPIFGYTFVAWSGVAIGFLSFTVWAHHMFAVGLPTVAQAFFASTTTLIAIPTAVKIFNWVATLYGGRLRFRVPMLFALAFVGQFLIGGLNGAALAVVPFDYQVTDTYFVVSHLHYVLMAGSVFGVFAGLYYWFPKMSGRILDERLGKIHFWLWVVGANLAFFPMHILGLMGMPRRQYTYPPGLGWDGLNFAATMGAYLLGIGMIVFMINWFVTIRKPATASADPWDAFTLEWATTSPPPVENFVTIPVVRGRRPLWDVKHPDKADWRTAGEVPAGAGRH